MQIGAGFTKTTKESNRTYISIVLNKELEIINPNLSKLLENCFISLYFVPEDERKSDKSPSWIVDISEKEKTLKKDKNQIENEIIGEKEIPF